MGILDTWTAGTFTAEGTTHPTYRKGSGPGVVVIHEMPGLTPTVVAFAEEVVAAGHTVVLPELFGTTGAPQTLGTVLRTMPRGCVSREFTTWATGRTSPVAGWLRALARDLHADLVADGVDAPGVGALGMCWTGGFALAMMVDPAVAAPVLCQPSLPLAFGRRRGADLGLSPADLDVVRERAAGGCRVLGLQYAGDPLTGSRFETLDAALGEAFLRVDLEGRGHSTVTEHRQDRAVEAVLSFFAERLLVG